MDILKKLEAVLLGDAALHDPQDASLVELPLDEDERFGAPMEVPSFLSFSRKFTLSKILEVRYSPILQGIHDVEQLVDLYGVHLW